MCVHILFFLNSAFVFAKYYSKTCTKYNWLIMQQKVDVHRTLATNDAKQ